MRLSTRRRHCSSVGAIAAVIAMAWGSSNKAGESHTWSAGGMQRRGALQLAAGSLVVGGKHLEAGAAVDVAGKPAALLPRVCLAPYQAGGCAFSAQVPAGWTEKARANPMRLAQWDLDPSAAATVVIFYLPLGQGSDAQLIRWESEFPEDSRSSGPTRSGVFDVAKKTPVFLDVAGSWSGGGPSGVPKKGAPTAGYRMRGAIVPGAAAVGDERQMGFFIKAVGPEAVLRANADLFSSFVASMQTS
ncbi:unnamed protein product [Polarella glacialis]|uniref:Uncharacterized protein n=1 Tax=Polarella glacialis TaxID=89957 RepID=A0A813JZZ5_POLGL|nr:unnamed protein product [Polarella glacialis]